MDREEQDTLERSKWVTELLGKNVNLKLDDQDIVNAKWSLKQEGNNLHLFDDAMGLFVEMINSSTKHVHNTNAQNAHIILAIRSFNDLRVGYKLLIEGYYAQVFPLLRSSFECCSRMRSFLKNPHKAARWSSGSEIPDSEIRKEFDDKAIWSEIYSNYSGYTHINFKAMAMHVYDTNLDEAETIFIGGHQNAKLLRMLSTSLINNAVLALAIASTPYKNLLAKQWHTKFDNLRESFVKLNQSSQQTNGLN